MSVTGEFLRVLSAYVELLEAADADGAERCATRLREISEIDRGSGDGHALDQAARSVLTEARSGGSISDLRFRREGERERFATDTAHLVALCQTITGERSP